MAPLDPKIKAIIPKIQTTKFFQITQLYLPNPSSLKRKN